MHVIVGTHKIKREHLSEYLESMRAYAAVCVAEPGCVRYEVLQDLAEPTVVCLVEVFRDAEAFAAHQRSEHHDRWMARSAGWREVSPMARHELDFVYPPDGASG